MKNLAIVGSFVEYDSKILMIQEKGKAYGLWNLPMGHVNSGETLEQAAIRETQEKTGYLVTVVNELERLLIPDESKGNLVEIVIFKSHAKSGNLIVPSHLINVQWVEKSAVLQLNLRGKWLRTFLIDYLKKKK